MGAAWAFVEVKVGRSPLIPSQIEKDRLIETSGYIGLEGPVEIIGQQPPAEVTPVRVKIE